VDVTVIVTTMGDIRWERLAWERAIPSAAKQADTKSFHCEETSLGHARNLAVDYHDPQDWICFLDADDELEPGYIEAMSRYGDDVHNMAIPDDLLVPRLRPVNHGAFGVAQSFRGRDILTMNPCPIGTLIHRSRFEEAERFWDEPVWEDWSLFRRCYLLGSVLHFVDDAVYRAYQSPGSRNSKGSKRMRDQIIAATDRWGEER
jgi:glycosyltransferase involved in cell wall biosynthesis